MSEGHTSAQRNRLLTRDFGLLTCGHLLQALGYSSLLLLPLYLHYIGASRLQIGLVVSVSALSGLFARPAIGWAIDAVGRRPTVLVGTALLVLSLVILGPTTHVGFLVYSSRVFFGLGAGALFTAYFAWAADIVPEARRTEGLALFGVSGLLPLALNPFVEDFGIAPRDLSLYFPIVGVVIALSFPIILALPEPPKSGGGTEPISLRVVVQALLAKSIAPVWLATFVLGGLIAVYNTFATVTADSRGIERPAGLWLTYTIGAVLVRILGARLPDRLGTVNVIAPAVGLYGAGFLCAAEATTAAGFLVSGALAGVGHGYGFPVLASQVVTRTPVHLRGSALAMFTAIWELSTLILPPAFGIVGDRWGDQAMLGLGALGAGVGLVVWAVSEHRWGGSPPDIRGTKCATPF